MMYRVHWEAVATAVRETIRRRGVRQSHVARELGLAPAVLTRLLREGAAVSADSLANLLVWLGDDRPTAWVVREPADAPAVEEVPA
jgi:transcriptional regulator with XRE-family HTH domain